MVKSDDDLRGDESREDLKPDQTASPSPLVLSSRIGRNELPDGSPERLEMIANNIPGIVFQLQLPLFGQPRFNFVNRGIENIWNISPEEAQADFNLFWQRILIEDRGQVWESLQFSAKHQRAWKYDFRSRFRNGRIRWMRVQANPEIESETGDTIWNGILLDITDQKNAEQRLRQAAIAFANTNEGVMITDPTGRIVDVNRAFTFITGFSEQEALGRSPRLLKSDKHDSDFYRSMWEALETRGEWKGEIWNRRKNGETYPQWLRINAVRDHNGRISNFVAVFADISSVKESEAKLMHMAHHDALTGLPNRLLFKARLEHALNRSHRSANKVALLFLDLDRFKIINDSLGHAMGDQVLQLVASRLLSCVREDDTVARVGGDEFIIVLENLSSATSAGHVADKILSQLSQPFRLIDEDMFVTTSIGISLYPDDCTDIQTLQTNADMAMYRAKEEGRNGYSFYTPDLSRGFRKRLKTSQTCSDRNAG